MRRVTSRAFQRNFARIQDEALEAISKAEAPAPNRETEEAMKAARRGELVTVGTVDELVADLNSED